MYIKVEKQELAKKLRRQGLSIAAIASRLSVAKSSVSIWVRDVTITKQQRIYLNSLPHTTEVIEKRRVTRITNEAAKREKIIDHAYQEVDKISHRELWFMGVMLYWAEGGKTQRLVRFSNGDPRMIKIMLLFFRKICHVPEKKFRGHVHIHAHLDHRRAEKYWSEIAGIPVIQFFKTYRKASGGDTGKNSLPYGVMDIYVLDTKLFLKILGWSSAIFEKTEQHSKLY